MKTERRLSRVIVACLLCLCAGGILAGCWSPPPSADLDEFIEYTMDFANLPGFAAVIVKNGDVVWARGYGWANIEEGIPVTPDTLFMTASVAKPILGTAVMQLYEQDRLSLDADVNDYLPFSVRNPNHPNIPITVRMLLTHTSSTNDDYGLGFELEEQGADSPITLRELLEGYLTPGGRWYDPSVNFTSDAPGAVWHYSNAGATLAAYLVEEISGVPFDEYCKENIFDPLSMDETSYRLRDLDVSHIAAPYEYNGCLHSYESRGHPGGPFYPVTFLRTSVNEFARFLGAFMNGGELDGVRILKADTVEEMLTLSAVEMGPEVVAPGIRGQALLWTYVDRGGQQVPWHNGIYPGAVANTFFLRDGNVGIAWFGNGGVADPFVLLARPDVHLDERLLEQAENY